MRRLGYDRYIATRYSSVILTFDATDVPQSFHNEPWARWEALTHPDEPVTIQTDTADIHRDVVVSSVRPSVETRSDSTTRSMVLCIVTVFYKNKSHHFHKYCEELVIN
jgi:hypothetical protein